MDIPTEWLSSQLILGVVLVVLVAVGVVFFFRVGGRDGAPAGEGEAGADHDGHDHGPHDHDRAAGPGGPSGPGTYGPIAPVSSASVFETEPCWVSLMPGRGKAAVGDTAPTNDGGSSHEAAPPARA